MTNNLGLIPRRQFIRDAALSGLLLGSLPAFGKDRQHSLETLMGMVPLKMAGEDYQLQPGAGDAFDQMRRAAQKEGIRIRVISSFRSYEHQKRIWTRKYEQYTAGGDTPGKAVEKIIRYSTMPGTSRHHWGTELDIIQDGVDYGGASPLSAEHFGPGKPFYPLKKWLNQHSEAFGFYEVYTNDPERPGFNYEPWHFSYKPLSVSMLKDYIGYDLEKELQKYPLPGQTYLTPDFIKRYIRDYVLGINKKLKV